MTLNLDTIIFITFLLVNLGVGLFYSRGTKNLPEYAIGSGDFSIITVAATVVATYIGAGFFTTILIESYRQGLYFIIPALGEPLCLIITGYFLIPRMKEFIGCNSVAETMGKFYGKSVRIISAICGLLFSAGIVAVQFKVAGSIMQLFGIHECYSLILSTLIVVLYSSFGGIKAVTFTDILQFFTFTLILPMITFTIWQTSDPAEIINTWSHNPLLNYKQVLDIHNPKFPSLVLLFIYFALPLTMTIDPAYVQRINMSIGVTSAKKSFIIAGLVGFVLLLTLCGTSILLLSSNPDVDPNQLLTYVIDNYTYPGLKGLTAICIMAIIMSTADSYINASSVLLMNDIINILKPSDNNPKKELLLLRFTAFAIGIIAFIFAHKIESIFALFMMTLNFYAPIVSVPLLLAVFNFRSSTKVVLSGMIVGGVTTLFWSQYGGIPGVLANLITFIIMHFISGKPQNSGYLASLEYQKTLKSIKQQHHNDSSALLKKIQCDLHISRVSISRLLKETVAACQMLYIPVEEEGDRNILLNIEPNIMIKCDKYLIKRSFENLIINAIQYCKKGSIIITLIQDKNKIIFSIKDSGIGIPKEDLNKIFEPFTVSSKTKSIAGGRGMGLAVVKNAIEIHSGSVVAESDSTGSIFTITLPNLKQNS